LLLVNKNNCDWASYIISLYVVIPNV
jgi:hypothetical protein